MLADQIKRAKESTREPNWNLSQFLGKYLHNVSKELYFATLP